MNLNQLEMEEKTRAQNQESVEADSQNADSHLVVPQNRKTVNSAAGIVKQTSQKQLEHLAKAREAKKRKAEDSIEQVLIDLRNYVKEIRELNNSNKEEIENSTKKILNSSTIHSAESSRIPEEKRSRFYDNILSLDSTLVLPGLAVLAMVTLGTIGFKRHYLDENNPYAYL